MQRKSCASLYTNRALRSSLNENCVLRSTEIVCFSQRASLNGNCVLRSMKIVCFSQRASPNGNCVLRSTKIVCFAQHASLNENCVLRPTRFAQHKLCALPNATFNAITFSSDSYKKISVVWTVFHVCHRCHYTCRYM